MAFVNFSALAGLVPLGILSIRTSEQVALKTLKINQPDSRGILLRLKKIGLHWWSKLVPLTWKNQIIER